MKNLLLRSLILLSLFIGTTNKALAHFGSKGPFGGYVTCSMVYDSLVYLGTANGGVYRSTNSSLVAWSAMPVGLKSGKISALAHTGKYLFAGTLDSGVYIYNGFVGTDRHWIKINNGIGNLNIRSMIALDSISLLIGTDDGSLFKTTDKGANWSEIHIHDFHGFSITAMAKVGNRIFATLSAGGVYVSSNNGTSWTSMNDANTLNIAGTVSMAYNETTNELAIINKNGVYILANASATTTPVYILAQTGLTAGTVLRSIATNGTNWYLATDKGVYTSATGTISWATANSGLKTTDVMVVQPFRTNLVLGTNKAGVFKTAASTIAWVENNTSYNNVVTYSMETSGVAVVIAATENGVFVSKDLAATYVRANNGLTDSLNVNYLRFFGTVLYAGTKNGGVFMSADTGKTWTAANGGLTNLNIKKIFASNTNVYILDANNALFQLVGSTWTAIQTGLPTGAVPTSMAFYGTKLLLGTLGQGVFTREAASGSWTAVNTGLTNMNVTSVAANASGKKIFAGTDGSGVFVSDVASPSWKQTSSTQTAIPHTALMDLDGTKIQELAYYAGYIFASYKGGLLATSDNGTTWIAGGNQFNLPSYTAVYRIAFVTTRVFVTTENNALYSNALSELPTVTGVNDIDNDLSAAISISPNPAKGNFNIQLKDLDATVNSVTVYDNMGRLMQTITNVKGLETISVSAAYPTGMYFVRLNTDKGIAVKKVVIE